jgi:uncharacterized protein (DUF983 family)
MNHRSCPKCGHEVPKSQRYLRNWSWATWKCSSCGAMLGFSQKPRSLMMLLDAIIIALVVVIKIHWRVDLRWWLFGWLVLSTLLVVPLVDRIIVIRETD